MTFEKVTSFSPSTKSPMPLEGLLNEEAADGRPAKRARQSEEPAGEYLGVHTRTACGRV
jgi:hypothetical protein